MIRPSSRLAVTIAALLTGACQDLSSFSTNGDHYVGQVVQGGFVRTGIGADVRLCLTLDTEHLQDGPGTLSTSDGRFHRTPLRPIPQIWHDPLSTLSFGDSREKNLVYVASPVDTSGDTGGDVLVVISLMKGGSVEVRLLRSAPVAAAPGPDGGPPATNLFAVFPLDRESGECSF